MQYLELAKVFELIGVIKGRNENKTATFVIVIKTL